MNKFLIPGLIAFAFTMGPLAAQATDTSVEKPPVDTSKVENKPAPVVPTATKEETPPVVTPKDETAATNENAKDESGVVKTDKDKEVKTDAGCPAAAAGSAEQAK